MSAYGAKERSRLASLAETMRAADDSAEPTGRIVADKLRTELPDLDDLTIGRVLIALTTTDELGLMFLDSRVPLQTVWKALAATGLHLTEPEWEQR